MSQLPIETLILYLNEARTAYHKLMTGTAVVQVRDQNGELVQFNIANRNNLYLYIQQLEALVCPPANPRPNRPMGFVF